MCMLLVDKYTPTILFQLGTENTIEKNWLCNYIKCSAQTYGAVNYYKNVTICVCLLCNFLLHGHALKLTSTLKLE